MEKEYDIFISYRREGGDKYARTIQQALEKQFRVFLDFDELEDGIFNHRIIDAISVSPVFLLVLSKGSLDRCINDEKDWVRLEILQAVKSGCHIVPVTIIGDDFEGLPEGLPEELRQAIGSHQFSQLHMETLFKESIAKLVKARIAPYIYKEEADAGAEIHIETDADCKLFHFKKSLAMIHEGQDNVVRLRRGKHKLEFVSVEYEAIKDQRIIDIPDEDYTDFIEVEMKEKIEAKRKEEALVKLELYRIEKNGKYGFKDNKGNIVISCKWKMAESFHDGLALVMDDKEQWGYIDKTGRVVFPCQMKRASSFCEGLAAVQDDNSKWGFIDKTGKVVIPCQWKLAYSFSEGLARVKDDNWNIGFVNKTGKVVIPCQWYDAGPFREGLAWVKDANRECGFIDKTGGVVIPCQWAGADVFTEGMARVNVGMYRWGYIDKTGAIIIPCQWSYAWPFSGGVAQVKDGNGIEYSIDKTGKIVK